MISDQVNGERNILKAYNMLLYFAGTMIMYDPSNECIIDFWSQGILRNLPVSSSNPRFIKAASQLRDSITDEGSIHEKMIADYLRLFGSSASPSASPVESSYRGGNSLTTGKKSAIITEFYRSYGWESKYGDTIPDDHLGIELLFLTLMIEKYLELDDEACHNEMKSEIRRFIDNHLFSWVPDWNRSIQEHAKTLSYKGIGSLIQACTEDIYSMMGGSSGRLRN